MAKARTIPICQEHPHPSIHAAEVCMYRQRFPEKVKEAQKASYRKKRKEYIKKSVASRRARWDKEVQRERTLKRRYGIDSATYLDMVDRQEGKCGICGGSPRAHRQVFDVDHDHTTGRVRGLLCDRCNKRLAVLEDKEFCEAAEEYLGGFR